MIGWAFYNDIVAGEASSPFEQLLEIFQEVLIHTSGDVPEALAWLTEIDKEYRITDDDYGIPDFIQDLIDKGYLRPNKTGKGPSFMPSTKMDISIRKKSFEDLFGSLSRSDLGNHTITSSGPGDEPTIETRPYEFGDRMDRISITESLWNAQINHGLGDFRLHTEDLVVYDTLRQTVASTVLMIDISHSMILYGEDRITPAKKVAMALAELIKTRYPKDTLDIIVFGNDAWQISLDELPYLQVGPYHTNTVAGLELAWRILKKRRNPNRQVFMITDGKPTCIKIGKKYYKNPYGLDRKILNRTLNLAVKFKKQGIPITTFMIADDPYLRNFVNTFTEKNRGRAFYSSLDGLGSFVLRDYNSGKRSSY